MEIRPVRPADAPAITAIYNHYVVRTTATFETAALPVGTMLQRIETIAATWPYYVCIDADADGHPQLVGYCYAHLWHERRAYCHTLETTIYLAHEATGHGYGRALMQRLIAACRNGETHALIACITAENHVSRAFHERLGFRQVSAFEAVGRKFGRWLDVTDYELLLG